MKRRVLASGRLGILLVLLGVGTFAATLLPIGTEAPRDATWIFVPQDRDPTDYKLESVTLRLDLRDSSCPVLSVEVGLSVHNETRDYGLGLLQPLQVIDECTSASNPAAGHPSPSPARPHLVRTSQEAATGLKMRDTDPSCLTWPCLIQSPSGGLEEEELDSRLAVATGFGDSDPRLSSSCRIRTHRRS